jgi:hypothetical protein
MSDILSVHELARHDILMLEVGLPPYRDALTQNDSCPDSQTKEDSDLMVRGAG